MKVITNSQKATRAHTRAHNKRLVLKTIYDNDLTSRAEVARKTSLTRATISNVVAELLEDGLVLEVGVGSKTIGKPPTQLSVNPNAGHVEKSATSSLPPTASSVPAATLAAWRPWREAVPWSNTSRNWPWSKGVRF